MKVKIQNCNKEIRRQISKRIEKGIYLGKNQHTSSTELMNALYAIETTDNIYEQLYRKLLISVIFLDAYKMYSYKNKKNFSNDDDLITFSELSSLKDFDDLESEVSANISLFQKMIEASDDFHNLNGLAKVIVVRTLSDEENKHLTSIAPTHELDLDDYTETITLERLINNIKNQQKYYDKTLELDFQEGLINSVSGFIRDLYTVDKENAIKLILEIAEYDYLQLNNPNRKMYVTMSQQDIVSNILLDKQLLHNIIKRLITSLSKEPNLTNPHPEDEVIKKLKYKHE